MTSLVVSGDHPGDQMTMLQAAHVPEVSDDTEILEAFLDESRDNLDQLDRDLVELETRPGDARLLGQVFRTIHTIKGTCGFLGFERLEGLSHAGEDLLDALRAGRLLLDAEVTTSLLALVDAIRSVLETIAATGGEGDDDHAAVRDDLVAHLSARRSAGLAAVSELSPPRPTLPVLDVPSPVAETVVRVDVGVLDKLMNLVGELVLARGQMADTISDDDGGPLTEPFRQLCLVTAELQDSVMQARLQPVGTLTAKFHRIARDLAGSLGKQVRLETSGDDVGVDKSVHEALRDPLVHLVRNAIDHGIETPVQRVAAGKDTKGRLRIAASHRGDRIRIEVSDDGQGIDAGRLGASAVRAGLLTAEAVAGLGDAEALNLIFLPGLSTKDKVSNVSGRGVGMDVVRASINNVGGSIEVSSRVGYGTVFRIDVPLTLAIMPTVMVWAGGERYAIPQAHVLEVLHVDEAVAATVISEVGAARIMRRFGRLLPLIDLVRHLGVSVVSSLAGDLYVVVVEIGGRTFGIVVDEMGDSTDAVVRPLTAATRTIPIFAGVTILSDGRPSLIIDLEGLANAAGLVAVHHDEPITDEAISADVTSLLVATSGDGGRFAVPLVDVRRLEQFPSNAIESNGVGDAILYEGSVLPLLYARTSVWSGQGHREATAPRSSELLQTVVCETSAGLVGLVVDQIEDVVAEAILAPRSGVDGPATHRVIVGGQVTQLINVERLIFDGGVA